jgi:ERF superfamily
MSDTTYDPQSGEILQSPRVPLMPPEVAAAVIRVKKKVRSLGHDETNKFAGYKYVSVDKFYEEIGRLMAEAGLFVVIDEISVSSERRETDNDNGQVKVAVWITSAYELFLYHESGAGYGPIHRTIMVKATGPQAFGSGMSYVEKYFLRTLFKVPTGDDDADAHRPDQIPARGSIVAKAPATPVHAAAERPSTPKPSHPRRAEAIAAYHRIKEAVEKADSCSVIDDIVKVNSADLALIKAVSTTDAYGELMAIAAHRKSVISAETPRARVREPGEGEFATEDDLQGVPLH